MQLCFQFICQLINANRGSGPPPPPRLFESQNLGNFSVPVLGPVPVLPVPVLGPVPVSGPATKNSGSILAVESVRLAVHFLLNSYYHVKKRDRQTQVYK